MCDIIFSKIDKNSRQIVEILTFTTATIFKIGNIFLCNYTIILPKINKVHDFLRVIQEI